MPDGYVLRNADLARTARTLAAEGPSALYAGAIGRAVSATVRRPVVAAGAPFTVLLGTWAPQPSPPYTTGARQPTKVTYRGLDVYGVGPSSSGASTVREALNVLSGHDPGGQLLAQSTFSYLEVSRLAFADRNAYVGDIDDEDVPLRNLRSPASAAPRRCLIGSRHSPRRSTPATPTRRVTHRAVSLHRPVRNATRPITW